MKTYASHIPTCFDRHITLEARENWLIAPVSQTRDSGPLDLSNFSACLESLGGESATVEVHRFGHWGPGWYEIIIVSPDDAEKLAQLEEIAASLENYPVLNEEDFSRREWDDYTDGWEQYGCRDFIRALKSEMGLAFDTQYFLDDVPADMMRSFFESLIPSGDYYSPESDGVSIRTEYAANKCTRDKLAAFIREQRNTTN